RSLGMLHAEKIANADYAELKTDDRHNEPADRRREQAAKPVQQRSQTNLDQAGEYRHREHSRKPAGVGRQHGGTDVDRRKYRWREVSRADRTPPDGLQHGGNRQSDHSE